MTPIKVMMVSQPSTGGTSRHVVELANGCSEKGFDVQLVCTGQLLGLRPGEVRVDTIAMGREIAPRGDLSAARHLRRLIVECEPDVVHLHSSKAGGLGRAAVVGMRRRPAVVFTPHLYAYVADSTWRARWYRWLEVLMAPWTDHVIAVSESEARAAARVGAAGRVSVVRNGVTADPVLPRATGARRRLRIGWLGRMNEQKQVESALTASLVLARLGVDHELVIGGDGPHLGRVRDSVRELGVGSWIHAVGFVTDTRAFHASLDLLIITSHAEGLPYVGLDAMAHGVPIVGYDAPGIRDLVQHGVTGLLSPPSDPGALAAQLARLCRNTPLRHAMGKAARARAHHAFRLDEQIERVCDLYRLVAARRHELVA